ncbi:uncharacterized protein SPSK_02014 [Sporothrix schenckii 1099-18]|uniref:Uncharacterized protein n=1 Tax=Sporothrix schenckii 1099-18 TaxID=1397361 RepID=A0A0F2MCB4_SPOSC|nr:uncharacterized protein SPSK_02014 [Sporothrix schenckii 1099-18]KJR87348.1 hypothetical protein SPSK_02014 [Sporothrix schenckii 1099-18]
MIPLAGPETISGGGSAKTPPTQLRLSDSQNAGGPAREAVDAWVGASGASISHREPSPSRRRSPRRLTVYSRWENGPKSTGRIPQQFKKWKAARVGTKNEKRRGLNRFSVPLGLWRSRSPKRACSLSKASSTKSIPPRKNLYLKLSSAQDRKRQSSPLKPNVSQG